MRPLIVCLRMQFLHSMRLLSLRLSLEVGPGGVEPLHSEQELCFLMFLMM